MSDRGVVLLTGGTGYLGRNMAGALEAQGWNTRVLGRSQPPPGRWRLGDQPDERVFDGVDVLLHAAYDMVLTDRREIREVNIEGTRKLFDAAVAGGVRRIIMISSIAAFEGCPSDYGRAKLECEHIAAAHDAVVIRPGMVYGAESGGIYAAMEQWVKSLPVVPVLAPSPALYTCHIDDLRQLIVETAGMSPWQPGIVTAACPEPVDFREAIRVLQQRNGVRKACLPVPWRLPWLALRAMELVGLKPPFRSDGLVGLMKGNPAPDFSAADRFQTRFRSFSAG